MNSVTPGTNSNHFVYEEYIKDFFWNPFTEQPIEYLLENPNLYEEKSSIFDLTFQLYKYLDEFIKNLFDICIQDSIGREDM